MSLDKDFLNNVIVKKIFSIDKEGFKLYKNICYSAVPAESYAFYLQQVADKIKQKEGKEKAEEYMFSLGYDAAVDAGKEMKIDMGLMSKLLPYRKKILQMFTEIIGFGSMDFKIFNTNQQKILFRTTNNPVVESAKKQFGKKSLICNYYAGVYCAHINNELNIAGKNFIETQCVCKGNDFCEFSLGVFNKKK